MKGRTKGLLFVFVTALISGVSIFLNKFGVSGFDPFVFTSVKNLFVGLMLFSGLLLTTRMRELKTLKSTQWKKLVGIGFIGGSIPFLLFFAGLQMASAPVAAFIHKTMVVWVALLGFVFLKEKLSKKQVLGIGALMAGLVFFSGISPSMGIGELMVFAATLFWAGEMVLSKHMLKDVSPLTVMWSRMFFGSFVLVAFLALTGRLPGVLALSGAQWSWIVLTSVFLLGYVFTFYSGLKLVKASEAAGVLLLGSLITTVLSWGFFGAVPSLTEVFGGFIIVLGISMLSLRLKLPKEVVPSASPYQQK